MPNDQITVRIVGDASGLKTSTTEAAASVEKLGESGAEAAPKIEKIEGAFAHVSGHIAGHALGMGRMARSIATVGEAAIGLTPFLATMIPVVALVAGVEILNKVEEAELKVAEAEAGAAQESQKLSDKLLDLKEKYAGLTQGALAEATLKTKDFGERQNEVSGILERNGKLIDAYSTKWASYVSWVQKATDVTMAYATGGVAAASLAMENGSMSDTKLKETLETIGKLDIKNKDYAKSLQDIQKIMNQLSYAGDPKSLEQLKAIQDAVIKIGQAAKNAALEQTNSNVEAANKGREVAQKLAEEKLKIEKEKDKLVNAAFETALKSQENLAVELDREQRERDKKAAEAHVETWKEANHKIAEDFRLSQKSSADAMSSTKIGVSVAKEAPGIFGDIKMGEAQRVELEVATKAQDDAREKANELSIALMRLHEEMRDVPPGTEEYKALQAQLEDLQRSYDQAREAQEHWGIESQRVGAEINRNAVNIKLGMQQTFTQLQEGFNNAFTNMMVHGQSFGQSMQRVWQNIASSALQSILKQGEYALLGLMMHKKVEAQKVMVEAKHAAASAFKGVMGAVPFPFNVVLAPAAAAAAFTGVMAFASFAQGGIMENDGGAMLHKNEMVLPPHISQFVQQAAKHDVPGVGEGGDHFHYAPVISAIDRNGMEDALKDHGDQLFSMWKEQLRLRNV